ncbi:MAG: YhcH/YjgK/YiaL family protein [Muribaculaceae bacterium]|nr:YhcH/YjgK/YiaL family protein [Muribaculaceae bacterium]
MIIGEINHLAQIPIGNELLSEALKWVAEHYKDPFEKGSIFIRDDKRIKVNYEIVAMLPQGKQMLEAHRQYIDIHVPISSEETIGWASLKHLRNITKEYNTENDIEFYGDEPQSYLTVYPGQCAIFFPEDAHAPNIGIGRHKKLCIKIAVN